MDLHHIGSDELLYIETQKIALTIKGSLSHPCLGAGFKEDASTIRIMCIDDFDISLFDGYNAKYQSRTEYASLCQYQTEPLFYEQQRYELVIEAYDNHHVEFWHDNYNIRNKITPVGRSQSLLSGTVNFGNEVGMSDLVIYVDNQIYLTITLEVFPSKISYKEDYQAIVTDVTNEVYSLVFDFLKKTYNTFEISSNQQSSMVEFFAIINRIYNDFITSVDIIIKHPHHQLQKRYEIEPVHKIKRSDHKTIKWLSKHSGYVKKTNQGILAQKALTVNKTISYDTKENRLTKYMLMQTVNRLEKFKKLYSRMSRDTDEIFIQHINSMINGIQRRCQTGFMKDVNAEVYKNPMTLVFGMAPGYRELYRCYLLLQRGLMITGDIFNMSIKDLAVLYEYWCFIKLNSLLKVNYKMISQDIIRVSGNGLFVSLIKGQSSQVKYVNPKTDEIIILSYNPKKINVPTVTQKPDNVLRLEKKGSKTDYEYVFDAKYRVNAALPDTYYYNNVSQTAGPEVDDINTMHRYRDAIVYQNNAATYERAMFGAYVLFPLADEENYKEHRFYKSIDQVNIGGLPFLPSATNLVTEMLSELISDSSESAFERATLPFGIERKLAKVDWSKRDVLIGTLRNKQQLDICLTEKFYHTPINRVPSNNLPIRYVAIYQTKALFGAQAKIEYYGEVIYTQIIKRSEIREIPSNRNDLYYRFAIKEWKKLSRPIEPKEKGFVVYFTNLFLLEHSTLVPELLLQSEEEFRLYTELKRHTNALTINDNTKTKGFNVGDNRIMFDEGNILLIRDQMIKDRILIRDFSHAPNAVFRRILKMLAL